MVTVGEPVLLLKPVIRYAGRLGVHLKITTLPVAAALTRCGADQVLLDAQTSTKSKTDSEITTLFIVDLPSLTSNSMFGSASRPDLTPVRDSCHYFALYTSPVGLAAPCLPFGQGQIEWRAG